LGRCLKCPGATDEGLAARLREWRDAEAHGRGLPASIVLTDETLAAVEERRPATDDDLRDIPGFRPDKIAAYGDQVLAIVAGSGDPAGARPTVESGQAEVIDVRGASDAHGDEPQAVSAPPDGPASV
jgi:ribonuclease D